MSSTPSAPSASPERLRGHASRPASAANVSGRATAVFLKHAVPELWHLLSLDAPTVAATWAWFVARCIGMAVSPGCIASLFLAVWILYAADRLLDARPPRGNGNRDGLQEDFPQGVQENLQERHRFHDRHRFSFFVVIGCASILLIMLLPGLGAPILEPYFLLGLVLVPWLLLIHARQPSARSHRLPKELVVGPFFAVATFLPAAVRAHELHELTHIATKLLLFSFLFAAVCTLNCLLLHAWEHPGGRGDTHPATSWAVRYLRSIAGGTAIVAMLGFIIGLRRTASYVPPGRCAFIPLACALAIFLLLGLHALRRHMSSLHLRVAADAVLLTPWLFLLLLR